jgi:hypothetical protein
VCLQTIYLKDAMLVFHMIVTDVCDFVIIVLVIPNLTGCGSKLTYTLKVKGEREQKLK